ncbi:MAG: glycoside hydrolase family 3 protein [Ilumatobacteraceae bacterium]
MTEMEPTLAERVALLAGADTWHTPASGGVPAIRMSDGPAGVRGTSWSGPRSASMPCGSALGATFDPDVVRAVGEALGREARSKSAQVLLAPTVNLHRTPVGGRNFECMSEDPYLTAELATAYIAGVQSLGIACCVKHFVGNDTEFQRMTISSEIDERTLREVYLQPFEAAVGAGVRSIMTGYNRLNGTFCADHEWLLRTVLRGEWGFDGVVVSDWFGLHSTVEAMRAGLDIEMPGPTLHRGDKLLAAVASGDVDESLVDEAAARIAALAEWTGAGSSDGTETTDVDDETRGVQHRAAVASTVLLTNRDRELPWAPNAAGTVAVIGPYADSGRPQGGGSARVSPDRVTPVLATLRARGVDAAWTQGCSIERYHAPIDGDVELEIVDEHGMRHTDRLRRTVAFWQEAPADGLSRRFAATMRTRFEPDTTGEWTVGTRSVGACIVLVDDDVVLEIAADDRGGSFFDYGSPERFGSVHLDAGRAVNIEVRYLLDDHPGIRAVSVGFRPPSGDDPVAEAVRVAASADRVLCIVGTDDDWETESVDRTTIDLPGRQNELIEAVSAVNPHTVVVVNAGSPVAMPWRDSVAAVMQIWFPGGALGESLADVIHGEVDPGGRLPLTFPASLDSTPAAPYYPGTGGRAVYGEGREIGHRWYRSSGTEPLFWFGHGLSYTDFDVSDVATSGVPAEGVTVSARIRNVGDRRGVHVAQVYASYEGDHPEMGEEFRLVGFAKVELDADAETMVNIKIGPRRWSSWIDGGWQLVSGRHVLHLGRSAGDTSAVASFDV